MQTRGPTWASKCNNRHKDRSSGVPWGAPATDPTAGTRSSIQTNRHFNHRHNSKYRNHLLPVLEILEIATINHHLLNNSNNHRNRKTNNHQVATLN